METRNSLTDLTGKSGEGYWKRSAKEHICKTPVYRYRQQCGEGRGGRGWVEEGKGGRKWGTSVIVSAINKTYKNYLLLTVGCQEKSKRFAIPFLDLCSIVLFTTSNYLNDVFGRVFY